MTAPSPARSSIADTLNGSDRTRLGRRLHLELLGQLADLCRWVAAVATKGLQKRELPSLAQRDTVLGDTCRMSATSAGWR